MILTKTKFEYPKKVLTRFEKILLFWVTSFFAIYIQTVCGSFPSKKAKYISGSLN